MEEEIKKEENVSLVKKKKKELILAIVTLLIILAVSFAWIRQTVNSNRKNVLVSGKLRLEILNEDPIIKAGGEDGYAIPLDDSVGLQTKPYTFTVKNTGTIDASFEITLVDESSYYETYETIDQYGYGVTSQRESQISYSSQRIADSKIKYNIREGSNTNTNISLLSSTTNRVLVTGVIAPKETKTYQLRLWISSDAEDVDTEDKTFAASLSITAIQYGGGVENAGGSGDMNPHIKAIYEYNQNGSGTGSAYTGCLGGAEAGCTNIINSFNGSSTYSAGTVIKYEVKDGVYRYFNVIHDDGSTLTLQERQNTVTGMWYGVLYAYGDPSGHGDNTHGPDYTTSGYALYELEQATNDWVYVNTQTYSIGNSSSTLGYSGCNTYNDCSSTIYTLTRTAKARLATVQELAALGCQANNRGSCKKFVYNYLEYASEPDQYGYFDSSMTTSFDDTEPYYYTLTARTNGSWSYVWTVYGEGYFNDGIRPSDVHGARAVIVINKSNGESSDPYYNNSY